MLKYLAIKDQNKINILIQLFEEEIKFTSIDNLGYINVLIRDLNQDLNKLSSDLIILKSDESFILSNISSIPISSISEQLFILYSENATTIQFINTMITTYMEHQELAIDVLIENLMMTRQNVYKLVAKINKTLTKVDIKLFTRNSRIYIEGNPINITAQLYRYYILYYRYVNCEFDYTLFQKYILLDSSNFIATDKQVPYLPGMKSLLNHFPLPFNNENLTFMTFVAEIGIKSDIKSQFWNHLNNEYSDKNEDLHLFLIYLVTNLHDPDTDSQGWILFDLYILYLFSLNIYYLNFNSYIEEVIINKKLALFVQAYPSSKSNRLTFQSNDTFIILLDLIYGIYLTEKQQNPIVIYFDISKGKIFNKAAKEYILKILEGFKVTISSDLKQANLIVTDRIDLDQSTRNVLDLSRFNIIDILPFRIMILINTD